MQKIVFHGRQALDTWKAERGNPDMTLPWGFPIAVVWTGEGEDFQYTFVTPADVKEHRCSCCGRVMLTNKVYCSSRCSSKAYTDDYRNQSEAMSDRY